jgi:hypothetical protein
MYETVEQGKHENGVGGVVLICLEIARDVKVDVATLSNQPITCTQLVVV